MAWIKTNYDRFLLAMFALILLVSAGLLINSARGYSEVFSSLQNQPKPDPKPPVKGNMAEVDARLEKLSTPDLWKPRLVGKSQLPLFVSVPEIAKTNPDGTKVLVNPLEDSSAALHPPVPNDWIMSHGQDLLASNVLEQDADGDGFSTLDEFNGNTDPANKDSHPPYWSKLYLKRFVRVPFHMRFEAKNGDKFFLNETDDEEAATQIKKIGETAVLGKYRFKLTKFQEKFDTTQGFKKDVSELTLTNVETGQQVVLPKGENVDSPTTYAVLNYVWNGPGVRPEFAVQRDGEFTLPPETNVKYKVVELSDTDVKVIKTDEKKELHLRAQGR